MAYVDGFVVPVPKKKVQAYRRLASKAGKIWKEHGAISFTNISPTTSRRASGRHSHAA